MKDRIIVDYKRTDDMTKDIIKLSFKIKEIFKIVSI